jgi:hypothetical protein
MNQARVLNYPNNSHTKIVQGFATTGICFLNDWTKFAHAFNACDFSARLQKCAPAISSLNDTENNYNDSYFQLYDIKSFLIQANSFLSSGFSIGVSVFSLITNLTTVAVIVHARRVHKAKGPVFKKDDELNSINEAFFTYMLANAVINMIYCLSFLLSTCISCVPKPIDEKLVNESPCVITNMCVAGVMSLMKLMGNYTYLLMCMNRYLLVGKDHVKWIETVA